MRPRSLSTSLVRLLTWLAFGAISSNAFHDIQQSGPYSEPWPQGEMISPQSLDKMVNAAFRDVLGFQTPGYTIFEIQTHLHSARLSAIAYKQDRMQYCVEIELRQKRGVNPSLKKFELEYQTATPCVTKPFSIDDIQITPRRAETLIAWSGLDTDLSVYRLWKTDFSTGKPNSQPAYDYQDPTYSNRRQRLWVTALDGMIIRGPPPPRRPAGLFDR